MHARFCSPLTGRFVGVDDAPGKVKQPQSWNRYAYALDSPAKYLDPDGREPITITIGAVALGAAGVVALYHAVKMQVDPEYHQRVVDGAQRTAEMATAAASSILSKTTKKDKNERDYDIVGPLPTANNKGGGRGRFQDYQDAAEQLKGVMDAQAKIRKGQAKGIIDSVVKSIDRLMNSLKDVDSSSDAGGESKDGSENGKPEKKSSKG